MHTTSSIEKTTEPMKTLLLALALSAVGTAQAAVCQLSDVKVTGVSIYSGTTRDAALAPIPIDTLPVSAAACAGAFSGNDGHYPQTNLGYAGDGLLNGGAQMGSRSVLFPGGAFISEHYPLQDLRGDGTTDDPGWIMLGKSETQGGRWQFSPSAIGGDRSVVLDSFFSVTETSAGKGTWSFTPDAEAARRAASVLGGNWIDQFAISFKAGNGFALYSFTSALFDAATPKASDPLLNWFGSYDLTETLINRGGNPAGLSHVTLWVRDPATSPDPVPATNAVPEPGSLGLLALALVGLGLRRRG